MPFFLTEKILPGAFFFFFYLISNKCREILLNRDDEGDEVQQVLMTGLSLDVFLVQPICAVPNFCGWFDRMTTYCFLIHSLCL